MNKLLGMNMFQYCVLNRLQKYMGKAEKKQLLTVSLRVSKFDYCPLVWHFSFCESIRKIEKIQKRCLFEYFK